jgi:transcriptional regulator with XRE-family HTH domain
MLGNKAIMAKNIQYYMDLRNKSRSDMCEALGVKYTTFTDWVKGNSYPRIDKIEMMANYFGINKSDLVEEHTDRKAPPSPEEEQLLEHFNQLNRTGREKVLEDVESMTYNPRYKRGESSKEA